MGIQIIKLGCQFPANLPLIDARAREIEIFNGRIPSFPQFQGVPSISSLFLPPNTFLSRFILSWTSLSGKFPGTEMMELSRDLFHLIKKNGDIIQGKKNVGDVTFSLIFFFLLFFVKLCKKKKVCWNNFSRKIYFLPLGWNIGVVWESAPSHQVLLFESAS